MSIPRNLGNFADNVNVNGKVEVTGINATGTPSASTVLFGNGTWAAAGGGSSQWVTSGSDIYYNTGNVAIGNSTPSAWATYKALQISSTAALSAASGGDFLVSNNVYINSGLKYITTTTASYYYQYAGAHSWHSAPSGTAGTTATFTQILAVEKDKSLALQGATSNAGTGITFPATQSASSDANTLDDYEEGTWTPTVTATTGSYTTYVSSGLYTKVGRLVTMTSYFRVTNKGTGAGLAKLTNFPFGAVAVGGSYTSSGINENTGNITCAEMFNAAPTTAYIGTATGGDPVTVDQGMSCSFVFYTS